GHLDIVPTRESGREFFGQAICLGLALRASNLPNEGPHLGLRSSIPKSLREIEDLAFFTTSAYAVWSAHIIVTAAEVVALSLGGFLSEIFGPPTGPSFFVPAPFFAPPPGVVGAVLVFPRAGGWGGGAALAFWALAATFFAFRETTCAHVVSPSFSHAPRIPSPAVEGARVGRALLGVLGGWVLLPPFALAPFFEAAPPPVVDWWRGAVLCPD
ncbi:hypothetical protein ALC60_00171, partial [Trachymyrmex zeteki]